MNIKGIAVYSVSALIAGLIAALMYCAIRRIANRAWRPGERREWPGILAAGYIAGVVQIIGLRIGVRGAAARPQKPNWIPLRTTMNQWRLGTWAFVYHTLGNIAWFVPLGFIVDWLFKRCRWYHALLGGAALSTLVELMQYLLKTGMPDIDDVILNALGTLIGFILSRLIRRQRASRDGNI